MNLFFQPGIGDGVSSLSPDESRHAIRVLRLNAGDTLEVTDGKGTFYTARITHPDALHCTYTILSSTAASRPAYRIHIAIAPTKNADRIEWFVEKAVELGIDRITLMQCANSERAVFRMDRLEKVAISAMKQSQQAWLPELISSRPFEEVLTAEADQKFIAFVDNENPHHLVNVSAPGRTYLVLIGPEGDFSGSELQRAQDYGFRKVTLGTNRLRTETAGLAACHILNLVNQFTPTT